MARYDKHISVYFQEAVELLGKLEQYLLELEASPKDREITAKVFRVIHTIKGTSAMFGFESIEALTHEAETIFDMIRDGRLDVTKELIDLSLEYKDVVRAIIDAHMQNNNIDNKDALLCAEKFRRLIKEPGGESSSPNSPPGNISVPDDDGPAGPLREYRIRFSPSSDMFLRGIDPMKLIDELHGLGHCSVYIDTEKLPSIDALDSEKCYTSWDISLNSRCNIDEIKDVFFFVEDDSDICITTVGDDACDSIAYPTVTGNDKETAEDRRSLDRALSVRVEAEKLDTLVDLVGEMVTIQASLNQAAASWSDLDIYSDIEKHVLIKSGQIANLISVAEKMEMLVEELRDNTMELRMFPIGTIFEKFRRLVRDLSGELGKDIELVIEGGDTKLDKTVIESLSDPLVHLIRNCIDHGIESPSVRKAAGKAEVGQIILSAEHFGDTVIIQVKDNGSGIDVEKVREKAVSMGSISKGEEIGVRQALQMITEPGFTTASMLTNVSGRGVGMDVVKRNIEALRGTLEIESKKDVGTTITLRLPLTLAIIDGLLVRIGAERYIIPLSDVVESVELTRREIVESRGRDLARVRGELIPYINLRNEFSVGGDVPEIQHVVITGDAIERIGLVVDEIIGGHQTVIKSLGGFYRQIKSISGATILGDGSVALILNVQHIVSNAIEREKESIA